MLSLNFNICQINSCIDLEFTETTGIYSTSNPSGYGAPNIVIGDVLSAVLTSTSPSGIVYSTNLFTQGFPSDNTSYSVILTLTNETLEDGKWTFTYTITTLSTTYTKTIYKLFACNSECCVKQMLDNIDLEDCGCTNKSVEKENYLTAWTFLELLKNAAQCGDIESFTKLKKIVDKLCKNKDCKTCK